MTRKGPSARRSGRGRHFNGSTLSPCRLKPILQATVAILAATSLQADYQAGLDAYQAGDYGKALAEWKEEVSRPAPPVNLAVHREALYAIAMLYWKGEGVAQDYAKSAVWLKQAADINHPGAQVKLGYLYSTGQGVPQNYREARRWLQMAAVQGDPDAAYNLDILDREGLGLADSPDSAGPHPVTSQSVGDDGQPAMDAVAASASEPPVTPQRRPAAGEPGGVQTADVGWIRERDPDRYTIQVIALRNPQRLFEFAAAHPDWAPFAIYRPVRNVLPLFVLLQGDYPDAGAAQAAADRFPPGLQEQDRLLVRKFGGVQGMIE